MATTPPPRSTRVLTPPTPLHGPMHDSPRRSSRIHTKAMHSPPAHPGSPQQPIRKRQGRPPSSQTLSPPSSPISPKYAAHMARKRNGKASKPPADLDPLATIPRARNGDLEPGMLPTPHKTPRKRAVNIDAPTARLLFPTTRVSDSDDLLPTPKKSRLGRKNLASTLESFGEESLAGGPGVEIYTDSKERVPEMDDTDANPFLAKKANQRKTKPLPPAQRSSASSKPRYGMSKDVDAAVHNDQGMVYTFRGKKFYRPFADDDPAGPSATDDDDDELGASTADLRRRAGPAAAPRLTRSAIKPRLLFPSARGGDDSPDDLAADEEEEEAETDIDVDATTTTPRIDDDAEDADEISAATPAKGQAFRPMTPPTTRRKGRASPFDAWPRAKPAGKAGRAGGGKRAAAAAVEEDGQDAGAGARSKRSRSAQVLE